MQPTGGRSSLATGMQQDLLPGSAVGAGKQQEQQLGYGQAEHAHMLTAIRQPLFIQTPLQVMLETLVEKLQLQANVIAGMQEKIDGLERNKLSGAELLSRIQLLENRVDAATAVAGMCADTSGSSSSSNSTGVTGDTSCTSAAVVRPCSAGFAGGGSGSSSAVGFSPFAQAKLIQQVAAMEQQTAALQASSAQLAFRTEQCETRLAGVSNLAGALMAVDMMAAEIGITVPHPPLSALTAGQEGLAVETQQQQRSGDGARQPQQQQQQHGSGNVLTVSRQQLLQQQIDEGKQHMAAVQQHLQQLQQQVDKLASDAAAVQDQQLGVLAGLQDSVSGLSDKLTQQVALLRREFKPALQATELHQLSTAEFTKVQRQVEGLEGRQSLLAKELATFKAKEFTELSSSLGQLSRRVAKLVGGPGALTETERALAAAQADLRNEMNNLSARFAAVEAAEMAGAAAAQQGTVQETSNTVRSRPSQDDMRATINKAVTLALQAHIGVLSDSAADGSAARRSRCLVCDRILRDGSPPRCSTAPQQQQQQNLSDQLLPLFDHFRPATAIAAAQHAGMSPSAAAAASSSNSSRTQHAYAAASISNSSSRPRTGSPGRSQGVVPGSSSGPVLGPMGPGLQAAQLRQMSAQKAGRLTSAAAGGSSNSEATAGAAGGGCGIAGLMPVGERCTVAAAAAAAAGSQGPGSEGLFVADLVSSNLRIHSAHKAPVATAAAADGQDAAAAADDDGCVQDTSFIAAGLSDTGDGYTPLQQQQQLTGLRGAAMSPSSRPQTAALGGREGTIGAVRPSTAAAGSRPGSSSSSSPVNKASVGKRTPLFL